VSPVPEPCASRRSGASPRTSSAARRSFRLRTLVQFVELRSIVVGASPHAAKIGPQSPVDGRTARARCGRVGRCATWRRGRVYDVELADLRALDPAAQSDRLIRAVDLERGRTIKRAARAMPAPRGRSACAWIGRICVPRLDSAQARGETARARLAPPFDCRPGPIAVAIATDRGLGATRRVGVQRRGDPCPGDV